MDYVIINADESTHKMLSANFNSTTTTLKDTNGKERVLLVDTKAIWVYYKPNSTWYLQ